MIKGETDREGNFEMKEGEKQSSWCFTKRKGGRERDRSRERDYNRYYTLRISLQHPNCCMLSQTKSNRPV